MSIDNELSLTTFLGESMRLNIEVIQTFLSLFIFG